MGPSDVTLASPEDSTRLAMSPDRNVSQQVLDQLAPTGKIRVAINFGNPVLAQKDQATGEPRGISPAIARELSRRTDLPLEFIAFDAAGKVFAALAAARWDVAFLAVDPARAVEIEFTAPYVIIEGSYLVRADSALQKIDDVDRAGVRILVGAGSAYDLYLTRTIRHALIVRAPTGPEALDLFLRGETEVLAGVKSPLQRFAADRPDLRVMRAASWPSSRRWACPRGASPLAITCRTCSRRSRLRGSSRPSSSAAASAMRSSRPRPARRSADVLIPIRHRQWPRDPVSGERMKQYQVGVIVGSLRRESINRKLAVAMTKVAPASLAFHHVGLGDLPMYNGDLEPDRPEAVKRFTAQCARLEAMLIVMPEYNRSLPAVLKNAIDWGSKPNDANVWRDKPIAICGASAGAIGTAVGQQHLRQILGILGASVMGGEAYISFKPGLVDDDGNVTVEATHKFLQAYMQRFAAFTAKLVGG